MILDGVTDAENYYSGEFYYVLNRIVRPYELINSRNKGCSTLVLSIRTPFSHGFMTLASKPVPNYVPYTNLHRSEFDNV